MAKYNNGSSKKYVKSQFILSILLLLLLVLFVFIYFFIDSKLSEPETVQTTEIVSSEQPSEDINEAEVESFNSDEIQALVDEWVISDGGESSVYITDIDGNVLASENPDQVFFAASLYKLFVAYAGYQQLDSGEVDGDEIYINGYTRQECLDLMIRDSDSPCAEKLWNELGKEELTEQLQTYGINNTSMTAITTTAKDSSLILARIVNGEGLSDESKEAYLDSMKEQDDLYRRGLPSGFDSLVVYNKVGWNELVEWHDTAIIELPDGRQLIVSVLSENVGFSKISELGSSLETYLQSL